MKKTLGVVILPATETGFAADAKKIVEILPANSKENFITWGISGFHSLRVHELKDQLNLWPPFHQKINSLLRGERVQKLVHEFVGNVRLNRFESGIFEIYQLQKGDELPWCAYRYSISGPGFVMIVLLEVSDSAENPCLLCKEDGHTVKFYLNVGDIALIPKRVEHTLRTAENTTIASVALPAEYRFMRRLKGLFPRLGQPCIACP